MEQIIFSDLDGTLLTDDKRISPGNRAAIRSMTGAGNSFVIATGRPFESAYKISEELGLNGEGCYIVSYNGSHVYDCYQKRVLLDKRLSLETVRELFRFAWSAGLYAQTYQDGEILARERSKEMDFYERNTNLPGHPRADVLDYLTKAPSKVIIIHLSDHERLARFQKEHEAWAKGKCRLTFSNAKYLEVIAEGVSKQTGIEFLMNHLGVDRANTIAVGDEANDIEMIKAAGVGIAVQNASAAAKEAADYVTRVSNNEDAIAEVVEKFCV